MKGLTNSHVFKNYIIRFAQNVYQLAFFCQSRSFLAYQPYDHWHNLTFRRAHIYIFKKNMSTPSLLSIQKSNQYLVLKSKIFSALFKFYNIKVKITLEKNTFLVEDTFCDSQKDFFFLYLSSLIELLLFIILLLYVCLFVVYKIVIELSHSLSMLRNIKLIDTYGFFSTGGRRRVFTKY